MSYNKALEAAGAKVIEFKWFGSYQGTWMAYVLFNGERVIVEGSYGSCSGCDAFQGEFYGDRPTIEDGKYYKTDRTWDDEELCSKEEYEKAVEDYQKRLSEFGAYYLKNPQTREIIQTRLENLEKDDWFSEEEKEYLTWALEMLNSDQNPERSVATTDPSRTDAGNQSINQIA